MRRQEVKTTAVLKKTRYLWLKNPGKLTAHQQTKLNHLRHHKLKTGRAYRIKLTLQELFNQPDRQAGEEFLKRWYFWATHSRLQPVIEEAKAIKRHRKGILNWFAVISVRGSWKASTVSFRRQRQEGIALRET